MAGMLEVVATGNAEIDRDHRMLMQLLERAIGVYCCDTAGHGNCILCAEESTRQCDETLEGILAELGALMDAHFQRESDLMKELPRTPAIDAFCGRHHLSHTEFLTRYAMLTAGIDRRDTVAAARNLGTFLGEWLHRHWTDYDCVLAALLQAPMTESAKAHLGPDAESAPRH